MAGEIISPPPPWLPSLIALGDDSLENEQRLLAKFDKDFVQTKLMMDGFDVLLSLEPKRGDNVPATYRHLTTRGEGTRVFDPRRAERLSWVPAIIRNCMDPGVKRWNYLEGDGGINTYLWLVAHDFIVITRPKTNSRGIFMYVLVTAYCLDHEGSRRTYALKYERREGRQGT